LSDCGIYDQNGEYTEKTKRDQREYEESISRGPSMSPGIPSPPVSFLETDTSKKSSWKKKKKAESSINKEEIYEIIRRATLQEPEDIIDSFNSGHPDQLLDESTLLILFSDPKKAKKILLKRKELHTDLRDLLNINAPDKKSGAVSMEMIKLPWYKSIFHNPFKNEKYVSKNGHMEGVYDRRTGKPDTNILVKATFNFFDPNTQPNAHRLVDVDPYLKWGN